MFMLSPRSLKELVRKGVNGYEFIDSKKLTDMLLVCLPT